MLLNTIFYILASSIMLYYAWQFVTSPKDIFDFFYQFKLKLNYLSKKEAEMICAEFQERTFNINYFLPKQLKPVEYKFYRPLANELVRCQKKYGADIRSALGEIRSHLENDLAKESEVRGRFFSGCFQVFLFIFIVIFNLFYLQIALRDGGRTEVIFDKSHWQVFLLCFLGASQFLLTTILCKIRMFKVFDSLFKTLYQLRSMSKLNLPISEYISSVNQLPLEKNKSDEISKFGKKLFNFFKIFKTTGAKIDYELQLMIDELWRIYDQRVKKFEKILNISLFFSIVCFFLPAFLLVLYSLSLKIG